MFNTTKALLTAMITFIAIIIVIIAYVITPPNSGVPVSVILISIVVGGLMIGWVYDTPHAY